jgi:uncharacterized protein
MVLALVVSLVVSAGAGDSPGSEPLQAIILGGGKTREDAGRSIRQWDDAQAKVGVSPRRSFPQIRRSKDVPGLKPGFEVTLLGFCPASEAQKVLERIRSEIAGAYVRNVTGEQQAECPVLGDLKLLAALASVKKGDLPAVKQALDEGLDVNAVETDGTVSSTLLDTALWARQDDMARMLLERGAKPTGEALYHEVEKGPTEMVRLLLEKKADPNGGYFGNPILVGAMRSGRLEVVTALLDAGADAKRAWRASGIAADDMTPLYFASACNGGPDILEALGKRGMELRATTPQGATMLFHAITDCFTRNGAESERRPEVVSARLARINALIAAGVDVNARRGSVTALHDAIRVNDVGAVKALVKAKANLTLADKEGNTPLHRAAVRGNPELLKVLLAGGAPVNALNERRESALYLAAWTRDGYISGMFEPLLEGGADVRLVSKEGYSVADGACLQQGNSELARDLIKRGAPFKSGKPTPKKCTEPEMG